MQLKYFIIFILFFPLISFAQPGCTDALATNFNNAATTNDGSCVYPATSYELTLLTTLADNLQESSGLSFIDGHLWTHNDGGNPDRIYRIDTLSQTIFQETIIATADNNDWEDMAEDDSHLFIGDFGNNPGNRTDLAIHRINKNDLSMSVVNSEVINFSYSDQSSFPNLPNNNNFDCEAFFIFNDVIHLFSKNWVNEKTKHYILPNIPGNHVAQLQSEFDVQGLITSAAIDSDGNVVLTGYTQGGVSFMWLLFDYQGEDFFSGNKRHISLGTAINTSQLEGVTFKSPGYGYVSAEQFSILDPKLFSFDLNQYLNGQTTAIENTFIENEIKIYPNPFDQSLVLELSDELIQYNGELIEVSVVNSIGKQVLNSVHGSSFQILIEMNNLPTGFYVINISTDAWSVNKKVLKH